MVVEDEDGLNHGDCDCGGRCGGRSKARMSRDEIGGGGGGDQRKAI